MSGRWSFLIGSLVMAVLLLLIPETALAYGGPGSIISGVGALFAVFMAIIASLFGFVWFPVKRFYRWLRGRARAADPGPDDERSEGRLDS